MMSYGKDGLLREYQKILEDNQPSRFKDVRRIEVIHAPYRTTLFPPVGRLTTDIDIGLPDVNEDPPQHKNYRQ